MMSNNLSQIINVISSKLNINSKSIKNTINLIDDGCSVPFISRYRKELTLGLSDIEVQSIYDNYLKIKELESRKISIINSISKTGLLTDDLKDLINNTWDSSKLEDIYLPYKPKKKTKAQEAKDNGLEPLAKMIMCQQYDNIEYKADKFINKTISDRESAIQGASDIIAEWISEDLRIRNICRNYFLKNASISSKLIKGKEIDAQKYENYFDYTCLLNKIQSHRLLAMKRGESEGFLKISIIIDSNDLIEHISKLYIKSDNSSANIISGAIIDSYKRLLKPSIEREILAIQKDKADDTAITYFGENLRQLLMAPPLGQKRTLGVDPGFKSGCKIVCLDAQGKLLHNETIYPNAPMYDTKGASKKIYQIIEAYKIEAIAIGNGTASRETEQFFSSLKYNNRVNIFIVSEDGASVYSASKTARQEFPDKDVTVRGAVSIGRRLMDPLAELVKIEPKSIGVGQYQHDVDSNKLSSSLNNVVESCVNSIGVNLNTASIHLLSYVSGLNMQIATNIIEYRNTNGEFKNRNELKKVPRLGAKTYQQCAGFLRIPSSENILDNTAVHPESYSIVAKIANDMQCDLKNIVSNKEIRDKINLNNYVNDTIGLPTLCDIIKELEKPGRDPRNEIKIFSFDDSIHSINDIVIGMSLPAIVTNITQFGCFVDLGIKTKGLIHISELSNKFISSPLDVVSMHQQIIAKVISVDIERNRIGLSLK